MNRREFFALLLTPLLYVVRPRPDIWAIVDRVFAREGRRMGLIDMQRVMIHEQMHGGVLADMEIPGRKVLRIRNANGYVLLPSRTVKWAQDVA